MVHRIATSGKYHERVKDLEEAWTLDDVIAAHTVLDLFETAERKASERARRKR